MYKNENYDFSNLRNKKVLVTGALGMLAYYYIAAMLYLNDEKNYDIKVYALARKRERLEAEFGGRNDVIILAQDVCSPIEIEEKIDIIFHAAGKADPESFLMNPVGVIKANIDGTENILEFAKKNDAIVIFPSTREVYGAVEHSPIKEIDSGVLDHTELRSCYPESKRMAENLIISYGDQFGVKYKIARLAHAYGPMMKIEGDGRVMADLLGRAIRKEDIVLKSDGSAKRAFCYVSDAVSGLLLMTVSDEDNQIYNLANETEEVSIRDLAEMLANRFNLEVKFDINGDNRGYAKFARTKLDTGKIEKLGWRPQVDLETGIKRTVDFFKKK